MRAGRIDGCVHPPPRFDRHGADEFVAAGESAVHGGSRDPGYLGDLLQRRVRVLAEDAFGGVEDGAHGAFGIGAQWSRGSHGHAVEVVVQDLAEPGAAEQVVTDLAARGISIDVLVNNPRCCGHRLDGHDIRSRAVLVAGAGA